MARAISIRAWAVLAAVFAAAALAVPAGADPTSSDRDLLIIDSAEVSRLEAAGFHAGRVAFRSPQARDNGALASDPGYQDIVRAVKGDLAERYRGDPAWGVGMRYSHRGFDLRWLRSPHTRWELAAVVNRVDRKGFAPGTCGELRFVYRLAYSTKTRSGPFSSRLPATLNAVFFLPDDGAGCRRAAAMLREPLDAGVLARPKSVEMNVQTARWPSTIRGDLGGHADYLLRVFRRQGARLVPAPLENTPDRERLRNDAETRKAFLAWLRGHAAQVDAGTALVPERFLARRAISVTPRGMARPQNRPWTQLFSERDVAGMGMAPKALLRRLDGLSCMGCHQSRSVAGFHVVGEERDGGRMVDALALGISPHLEEDLPRRRAYVQSLLAGGTPDESRRPPERQLDRGGYGEACGLDSAFAAWKCAEGLACRGVDDADVGQCMPKRSSVGDACETGVVDFAKDRIAEAETDGCGLTAVCEGVRVGFPGGMCATLCMNPAGHGTCGAIALLAPFNECLARGELFTKCAEHSRPARLRKCGESDPCRPDYLCARMPEGGSACLPPYFVLQMRVDGHPVLR